MLTAVNQILEVITVVIGVFLAERYVFLEPGMEPVRQRRFYIISIACVVFAFSFGEKDAATLVSLIAAGLNIVFGRKKHRLRGFFLILPLLGIINGICVPLLVMPPALFGLSETGALYYTFCIYGLLAICLLLFWKKGKKWRFWFRENMQRRCLNGWEKALLCITGVLMLAFSNVMAGQMTLRKDSLNSVYEYAAKGQSAWNMALYGGITFTLTFIIIVLIMQGNRRTFYHEQVADMQFNMISIMADIVENRDENTGGHIKRTARFVEIIAKKLQKQNAFPDILTEQYISDITVAAPLHDIGKIHISDVILNKPGRFTDEEFEIMKSHAAAGRDLLIQARKQLGDFPYLNLAIDMAAYHHEWWDGHGYPDGVSGEEIPLCARIMAVADVFDALSSKRCYKNAMPLEKAYSIIEEESGTHFDPVVAEAFLASKKEIETVIREVYDND